MKRKALSIIAVMSLLFTLFAPGVFAEGGKTGEIQSKTYFEQEVAFDGTDAAVQNAPSGDLSFLKSLGSVTMTTSFKTTNTGLQALMALNGVKQANDYISLYINAGNTVGMEVRDYSGGAQVNQHFKTDVISGVNLADGKWHTATLTISENNYIRFYVDQKLVLDSNTTSTYFSKNTAWDISSFTFGGTKRIFGNNYLFSGSMKDFKVSNGALTDEEILNDHGYIPLPGLPEPIINLTNMNFDGSEDAFVSADGYVEKLKTMDRGSFSFDLKLDESSYDDIIGGLFSLSNKAGENDYATMYIKPSTNKIGIEIRQGVSKEFNIPENLSLKNERWHNVTYVFTGTQISIYVDGYEIGTSDFAGFFSAASWATGADSATVGGIKRVSDYSKWPFKGTIVKARVFDEALTAAETEVLSNVTNLDNLDVYNEGTFKSPEYGLFDMGDNDTYNYRIPALVTLSDGTMIASVDQRNSHWSDWGNIDTIIRKSSDGGETWTDIVDVIDLKEQPYYSGTQAAFSIDPLMMVETQGENKDRVWILITTFPESTGAASAQPGTGYTEIGGKQYLTLTDALGNIYTLREEGKVYNSNNEVTDYTVKQNSVQPFNDMGDLYQNGNYVGNIYLKSKGANNDSAPLTVYVTSYLWLTYSDDAGESWSTPVDINPMVKEDWMKFCGVGPGTGLQIEDGTLVFPIYYTTKFVGGGLGFQSSANVYSTDGGKTWERGESPNDGRTNNVGKPTDSKNPSGVSQLTESQIVELNNGHLMQFMRNTGGNGKVAVSVSEDKGLTWGQVFDTTATEVYCQLSVIHYPELVNGKEIVIMSNSGGGGRTNGTLRIGEIGADDTVTWTTTKVFRPGNYAYSCLTLMPDNTIGLMYEHANTVKFTSFNLDFIKDETNIISPNIIGVSKEVVKGENNHEDMIIAGDTIVFTVTTDQIVFAKGQPQFRFQIAGQNHFADFVSGGTSSNSLVFEYVVKQSDEGTMSFRPKIVNDTKNAIQNVYGLDISSIDTIFSLGTIGFDPSGNGRDIAVTQMTATAGTFQNGEGPELVLDNNSATMWHTPWTSTSGDVARDKFWVQFDLKAVYDVDGLRYQPRQTGGSNGIITKYRIDVSLDGNIWIEASTGTWLNDTAWKITQFAKTKAKYVRIYALESVSNADIGFASAAEIRLTGALAVVEPETVDLTELNSKIANVTDLVEADYTALSWTELQGVITEAKALCANVNATQVEIDAMVSRLQGAIDGLNEKPIIPDPSEELETKLLEIMLEEAELQIENGALNGVIQIVVDNFHQAVAEAKALLVKIAADPTSVIQDEIEEATDFLIKMLSMLDYKADKAKLQKLVDRSEKYVEDKLLYRPATYTVFETAFNAAKAVIADETAFQDEIDEAWTDLARGIAGLRKIPSKDALEALLNKAKGIDENKFTVASYSLLMDETVNANKVLSDKNATEDEIVTAEKALAKALNGLVPLADTTTTTTAPGGTTTTTVAAAGGATTTAAGSTTTTGSGTSGPKTGEQQLPAAFAVIFIGLAFVAIAIVKSKRKTSDK